MIHSSEQQASIKPEDICCCSASGNASKPALHFTLEGGAIDGDCIVCVQSFAWNFLAV
jgi:hypothetical protein